MEINTHDTSPSSPLQRLPFAVENSWFSGGADVLTFATPELFATKIRALYQRSKGRDLFDLWLALTHIGVTGEDILAAFPPYRPDGITAELSEANLRAELENGSFRGDLNALVAT